MRESSVLRGALLCCVLASVAVGPAHAAKKRAGRPPAQAPKAQEAKKPDLSNRFYMTQGGKQMSADDFDAWMKSRGYRVATGAPAKGSSGGANVQGNAAK